MAPTHCSLSGCSACIKKTPESISKAIDRFKQAIERMCRLPGWALAICIICWGLFLYLPWCLIKYTGLAVFWLIVLPPQYVRYRWREHRRNIRALPRWRKRSLTPTREGRMWKHGPFRSRRTTDMQQHSPLFRLPAEIRVLIWNEVLADHDVPVEYWEPVRDSVAKQPANWWALPRTCRRIYSETINTLYTHTTFRIACSHRAFARNKSNMLTRFNKAVLPHRWSQIRSMSLYYILAPVMRTKRQGCVRSHYWTGGIHMADEWPQFCEALASLPELRMLNLMVEDQRHWLNVERLLLLRDARASDSFTLSTTWLDEIERKLFVDGDLKHIQVTARDWPELDTDGSPNKRAT